MLRMADCDPVAETPTPVANKSGRPEQVLSPGRSGTGGGTIVLQNHGVIGSQAQLEDWLVRSYDNLRRKRRI